MLVVLSNFLCSLIGKNSGKSLRILIEVKAHSSHGQIALHLSEEGGQQEYNLADMGFGFSQILPIVAQLWILVRKGSARRQPDLPKILTIEQPELHLHPNHQSKVADMFVAAIELAQKANIDLRLVVETHSETIINRMTFPRLSGHRVKLQV